MIFAIRGATTRLSHPSIFQPIVTRYVKFIDKNSSFLECLFLISHGIFPLFSRLNDRTMGTIAQGVDFDTLAREWRCKWSPDNDKKSLAEAQEALKAVLAEVKAVDGVLKVDRIVCGGCLDFKVRNNT
jgi:hypothetical protein